MGVINEYFLATSDAAAAEAIDTGPPHGLIGPDPGSELASLEAILLGLEPESDEALALIDRDDHAVDVAHDGDYSRMVIKIAPGTTQLIANTPLNDLKSHMPKWATVEELTGTTADDLHHMIVALHPLFVTAANAQDQTLYVWVSL